MGGLCRYCLKRSSKACPTVLMTLCASPSQHSRMWQAADRRTDGRIEASPVPPAAPRIAPSCPSPPTEGHRPQPSSSLLHAPGASVTSLVDGVLGDIGNVVRGVLGAQRVLRACAPLLHGEWGQGYRGASAPRTRLPPPFRLRAAPCPRSPSREPRGAVAREPHRVPAGGEGDGLHVVVGNDLWARPPWGYWGGCLPPLGSRS